MTRSEKEILQQLVNAVDLIGQLANEVGKVKKRVFDLEQEHKPENLLSKSEKKWAGISNG
tara:strand:- start:35 stop:214 length:180 start_codon:yes stop_codon:yes gene_type:complete